MADHEISKLMWIAVAVSLSASIFVLAKPQVKAVTDEALNNVQKVVDQIKIPSGINMPSTNPDDYEEVSNYADNGTFAMDKDGNAVIWATDKSKPITVTDGLIGYQSGDNTVVGKTYNNPSMKTLTIVSPMNITGNGMMFFASNTSLTSIRGLSNVDVSKVTSLNAMFMTNPKLKALDVSSWNTSNVTNFSNAFAVGVVGDGTGPMSSDLTSLKIGNMNTSKGTSFLLMFAGMPKLTNFTDYKTLDLSSANSTDMSGLGGLFSGTGLSEVDMTNVKLPKESNLMTTFAKMPNLKKVVLGQKVKITSFYGTIVDCPNIEVFDTSLANVSSVDRSQVISMFNSNKLKSFNVPYTDAISSGLNDNIYASQSIKDAYNAQKL